MRRHLIPAIVGAVLALGGTCTFADTAPSARPAVAQADAYHAFLRDHADRLSRSGDAHALLTAALLDDIVGTPTGQQLTELLARAERAAPNDPLVWWIAATQCRGQPDTCANAQRDARAKLVVIDSDNAVTWLLESAAAQNAGDPVAAARAFARAASAAHYDDHIIASVKVLTAQLIGHPLSADGTLGSEDEYAYIAAWAMASAFVTPDARVPFNVCTPNKKPVQDATTAAQCVDLARTMQRSGMLLAMSVGLRIEQRLLAGTPQEGDADRHERTHRWMLAHMLALAPQMNGNSDVARRYRSALYASNSESTAFQALMTAQGIPLDPPADWQEPHTY